MRYRLLCGTFRRLCSVYWGKPITEWYQSYIPYSGRDKIARREIDGEVALIPFTHEQAPPVGHPPRTAYCRIATCACAPERRTPQGTERTSFRSAWPGCAPSTQSSCSGWRRGSCKRTSLYARCAALDIMQPLVPDLSFCHYEAYGGPSLGLGTRTVTSHFALKRALQGKSSSYI